VYNEEQAPYVPITNNLLNESAGFPPAASQSVEVIETPLPQEVWDHYQHQVASLLAYAQGRTIASQADTEKATNDLGIIAKFIKLIEAARDEKVRPLNTEVKQINELFKTLTVPLGMADRITRDAITAYRKAEEAKRAEAISIENDKMELARREATLNNGAITVDLNPIAKPDAQPKNIRADVATAGTRKGWRFEVVDFALLPDQYKVSNDIKIRKAIQAEIAIPGVRSWQEETLAVYQVPYKGEVK
jgi:hypothetical protein